MAEMLFEYLVLPGSKVNERLAYVEFGGLFLLLFLAGLKGGQETGRVWFGVLTAIWSRMTGSLIWLGRRLLSVQTGWSFSESSNQLPGARRRSARPALWVPLPRWLAGFETGR